MRIGLFYEHQLPRPWEADSERRLLDNALEQVALADRLGFDAVWEVEHHFLEEYSHSSAPEVFLAAASQRTSRIRLGHGIVQLPPPFNHPARVAERIATLDLISGGRVEFGTGEASSQMELGGFGVDREAKREMWAEALDVVTRMLVETPFAGHRGDHLTVPPRNVIPKPLQQPHPPLWVACSRRETILLAAQKGIGALSFSFVEPEQAREWVDDYYRILASDQCVPAGFDINPNVAVVVPFMCHHDEQTAIDRGIDGAHFFGYSLAHYYVFGEHRPGATDMWSEFERDREARGFSRDIVRPEQAPLAVRLLQQGLGSLRGAIGTPDQIVGLLERYEAAGVDQVIFAAQVGHNRHEDVCESLELAGREVLPRFAGRAEQGDAERRERLAEARGRALARRPGPRPAVPHLVTPQGEPGFSPAPDGIDGRHRPAPSLRDRVRGGAEALVARAVRGRSDAQLDRLLARPAVQRAVFGGMARSVHPERAAGLDAVVLYELVGDDGVDRWTLRIAGGRGSARPGAPAAPTVTMRMRRPVLLRMASGELEPPRALIEGRLEVEGDLAVAARLGEAMGGPSNW